VVTPFPALGHPGGGSAGETNQARVGSDHPGQHRYQSGFAGPIATHKCPGLPGRDCNRHVAQGLAATEPL
jgi:hypothetical protein